MVSLAVPATASSQQAEERRLRRSRMVFVLLVTLGGVALSLWLGWLLSAREQELAKVQFKLEAGERIESIRRVVADRLGIVNAETAFFFGSESVERDEFRTFTQSLLAKHTGAVLLGWAPCILSAERGEHERTVRTADVGEYRIHELDARGKPIPGKDRDTHFPILFAEPADSCRSLIGFDLASNAPCRSAMYRAMTDYRQATFVGSSLDGVAAGHCLLYVVEPVWFANDVVPQRKVRGFTIGIFEISELIETALGYFPPVGIDVLLLDPTMERGKEVVYGHGSRLTGGKARTDLPALPVDGMHISDTLDAANSRYVIDCIPTEEYLAERRTWMPLAALLAALLITGLFVGYVVLLTGRAQHIERLVSERAAELQSISNAVLDAVVQMDVKGHVSHWNPAAERLFGYSRDEIIGRSVHDTLVPQKYRDAARVGMQTFSKTGKGAVVGKLLELSARRKDGTLFPAEISISPVFLDEGWGAIAIIRDVTARKHAEDALRREQRLLRDMLDLHERDRKLVAYEIHDGLAQHLTASLFRFQAIDTASGELLAESQEDFREGVRLLHEAMVESRRLISGLRPPVLDELGVVAAIEYLVGGQQRNGGPEIEFIHGSDIERLAPPLESSIFRIVQECLTNACRYSQSKSVRVELSQSKGRVRIDVQDWGVGFDPEQVASGHYGLSGIRERARLLGGDATIQSAPQQGTHITVELPLVAQTEEGTA